SANSCSAPRAARAWSRPPENRRRARSPTAWCATSWAASGSVEQEGPVSRWRPPPEKSTALITPEGHARLKAELDDLWRVQRPEVVKALSAAAAEGDRSENAEYIYRKK